MRIDDLRSSNNIEDRTDDNGGGFGGGFGGGVPVRAGGGLGTIIIIILVLIFGGGKGLLGALLGSGDGGGVVSTQGYQSQNAQGITQSSDSATQARKEFIAKTLGSNEDYWTAYFKAQGQQYNPPTLVMFRNRTQSSCGTANGATGPFYCPTDKKVYLDIGFFDDMARSLGARGDFAGAYVIAHEIGHHVQDEVGILSKAHKAMARTGEDKGADSLAVRIELQADCLAGTWAKNAIADTNHLEQGDIEEAMGAANAVGDDRLQKRAQGYAVPDSFTHGSSEQRMRWFNLGMKTGDPETCDTFGAKTL
jgi:uncharacterized protein